MPSNCMPTSSGRRQAVARLDFDQLRIILAETHLPALPVSSVLKPVSLPSSASSIFGQGVFVAAMQVHHGFADFLRSDCLGHPTVYSRAVTTVVFDNLHTIIPLKIICMRDYTCPRYIRFGNCTASALPPSYLPAGCL